VEDGRRCGGSGARLRPDTRDGRDSERAYRKAARNGRSSVPTPVITGPTTPDDARDLTTASPTKGKLGLTLGRCRCGMCATRYGLNLCPSEAGKNTESEV